MLGFVTLIGCVVLIASLFKGASRKSVDDLEYDQYLKEEGPHGLRWMDSKFTDWQKRKREKEFENICDDMHDDFGGVPVEETYQYQLLRHVADGHSDCTIEILQLLESGKNARRIRELHAGEPLQLKPQELFLFADVYTVTGSHLGSCIIPTDSNLEKALEKGIKCEAFMGGKDDGCMGDNILASIVVFFKMEGVPPTQLNIK